jgi:hypothetical protein
MKVYYAHAIVTYKTSIEKQEIYKIKKFIPKAQITNPAKFQTSQSLFRGMEFYFKLIDECETVIFTRYKNKITTGVGKEVNYAIKKGITVYELNGSKLRKVKKSVRYITRTMTRRLYGWTSSPNVTQKIFNDNV